MFGNTLLGLCRASGPPHGGRLRVRWTTAGVAFSVSGLARSGRPMPIPASCFRADCRCRSSPRFRSRGCRLFRFRSAARHLWADRVPALTTAGEAGAGKRQRKRQQRRQRRRLQHDDGAGLGFASRRCGGCDGRERDGARGDLRDGVRTVRMSAPRPGAARPARSK